jgi:phosphoribosyl-ATP pyrophosphohydrolase
MEAINKYVNRKFDKKGKMTTKLVETAEREILKKMYEERLENNFSITKTDQLIYS